MSLARLGLVFRNELRFHARRPLVWILLVILGLVSWGLSSGSVSIQSGDTAIGGDKRAFLTSEFSNATMLPMVAFLFYSFFIAVAAGMAVPRDDELNVGPVLHATRLTPEEYIWGKFAAALATFLGILAVHLLLAMFFNHLVPSENADKIRGPFEVLNYLRPAGLMALPFLVFLAGTSFAIGERSRHPVLVFVTPVAMFLISIFFLWEWSPSWLDPRINRLLQWIEPSGFRWINETWMKVDLGVDYYNAKPVGYDVPFLLSRLVYALVGVLAVFGAAGHFRATLRGAAASARARRDLAAAGPPVAEVAGVAVAPAPAKLSALGMTSRPPGFLRTVLDVARFEVANLRGQPGLYIFVPLILVQVIGSSLFQVGAFDTPLLLTSGVAAVTTMNTLTLLVAFLLLFYTTESVYRERSVRLEPIFWSTPARTGAVLFGKSLANGFVGLVILIAAFLGAVIVMLVQGKVTPDPRPFLLVWGLLLVPTFIVWASWVTAIVAATGSRWTTYGVGLVTLALTGWLQFRDKMNWVGNWDLWGATTWTDFDSLQPNTQALLMNRLFWAAVTLFLVVWTVRMYPRREPDSGAALDRMRGAALGRSLLKLAPFALPAIVLGSWLGVSISNGFQGKTVERREKEYHGRNLLTWNEANTPLLAGVDVDLELDPASSYFRVKGHYDLTNASEKVIRRFPMSVGDHFKNLEWTLNGEKFEPEHRARLWVFKLAEPLAPGDTLRVGFSHDGHYPQGITKNGGGMGTFILPCGVVLTSFQSDFLPLPFFEPGRGVNKDNRLDPREREDGFWEGVTKPAFGGGALYPVRTRITGPAEYEYHGVGVCREDEVADGKRTVVWETDHPVNFFNVVAGKWATWKGDGVEIYYLPKHTYNIEEMGQALVAARKWYSEWFYPYPWQDLRLNEFPALASYAQGFPTNITFSESIGFLTRSTPEAAVAFLVTAHESAHQWWGNILLPGDGPGGSFLSEGMAHYSTILLFQKVRGERERIEFCKRIEDRYGKNRQVDSERALAWIDDSKAGDTTCNYDKGGWVMWMLENLMGADACHAGLQDFIGRYHENPDHPMVQDLVAVMREHAPDPEAFDAFVQQWFFDVVVPRIRVTDAKKTAADGGWTVTAMVENVGTGRMPFDVAAVAGERWPKPGDKATAAAGANADSTAAKDAKPWHESRTRIELGVGEKAEVTIAAEFEPEKIVVDPDARVLMLKREQAERKL